MLSVSLNVPQKFSDPIDIELIISREENIFLNWELPVVTHQMSNIVNPEPFNLKET